MKLSAEGIRKTYGKRDVVKGVDLEVRSGEIVGLLGPNGAGKTTTFYSLVGFISPDGGRITLDDKPATDLPMHERSRQGIGYLAQTPTVFQGLTVAENLLAVLERTESDAVKRQETVDRLLADFGLSKLAPQKALTLSGGEKRRLEVARAMIQEPKIILLDEPFVGIDPITIQDLKTILAGLKERGIGTLISDHNVRETLPIIDRAYLMYDGKILLSGTSKDLLENEEARKLYLGEDFKM